MRRRRLWMHLRHPCRCAAALAAFVSFLFALLIAQPTSLAAVKGGDRLVPVVNSTVPSRVAAGGSATVPTGPGPPSGRTVLLAPVAADGPAGARMAAVPTDTTALLADFDGDERSDLFWYGPGAKDDHLWLGRPDRNFAGVPVTVNGSYLPMVGDFDGDGRADIFWYGPGTASDVVWYGQAGGGFAGLAVTVNGTYQPIVGDFDGNGRADICWYGPGTANDVVWYGQAAGGFAGLAIDMAGTYQPFTGDFNGDGGGDVFWYAPGAGSDVVWYGQSGGFSEVATPVQGTY